MEVKLSIIAGKASKSEIVLKTPAIIGRSRDADVTIAHPMVSRQHCEIFEQQGVIGIRDLGSLNGTFMGPTQISEVSLKPNDEFTVGPLTFRIAFTPTNRPNDTSAPAPPDLSLWGLPASDA